MKNLFIILFLCFPTLLAYPVDGTVIPGIATIGDGTNQVKFALDGEVAFEGTARVKKEVIQVAFMTKLGASAPTSTTRAIGASGDVEEPIVRFSKTTEQELFFIFHLPLDVDDSVNVEFHLMWLPGASWTTGNYMWKMEYLVKSKNEDSTTGTPTTIQESVTPSNAIDYIETEFATTINMDTEQVLMGRFYRDVANDNADDVGDARFGEIQYTSNKLGEAL